MFLRQHLSCSICRSLVDEHLISLGIPTTRVATAWAQFWWRAHNYVRLSLYTLAVVFVFFAAFCT
jgi:hypothetical protein